jgi:hypothetical protein
MKLSEQRAIDTKGDLAFVAERDGRPHARDPSMVMEERTSKRNFISGFPSGDEFPNGVAAIANERTIILTCSSPTTKCS